MENIWNEILWRTLVSSRRSLQFVKEQAPLNKYACKLRKVYRDVQASWEELRRLERKWWLAGHNSKHRKSTGRKEDVGGQLGQTAHQLPGWETHAESFLLFYCEATLTASGRESAWAPSGGMRRNFHRHFSSKQAAVCKPQVSTQEHTE